MIAFLARHATAANLLMLVFVLLGFLALPDLQRETYPTFESSNISVSVSYPGAPAEIVDDTVVQRVEASLATVDGITRISSTASEGRARISLEIDEKLDIETVAADVETAVESIRDLPDGVEDAPRVSYTRGRRAMAVVTIAVTGPMSAQDLKLYCERLKRELLSGGVVSQVSIAGFSTHRLRVRATPGALASHGLTLSDLASAISSQSKNSPVGTLEAIEGDLMVRYEDKRTTPEALGNLVIKGSAEGAIIRLSDVATVEDVFAVEEEQTWFNGQRAGFLVVSRSPTQDSLTVLEATQRFVEERSETLPDGVKLTLTDDAATVIDERLGLLLINGIQGLILVFAVLWVFFGIRMAFWVAAGLPVSFLGALWVMTFLGQSLNMMTAMGLLIALGLLMDDGIVLADNVAAHLARGKKPLQATIDGVTEVAGGVFSSFLTTICVFVPLSAIDGSIGRTLQVIPVVLIAVLAVSLIEAFLILPNHLGHSLEPVGPEHTRSRFRRGFDSGFEWVRERLIGRAVDALVRYRYATVGVLGACVVVAMGLMDSGRLQFKAFPQAEGDTAQYALALEPGTPLEKTQEAVERVVGAAWAVNEELSPDQPDGQNLVRNVSVRYNYNRSSEDPGPHLATVTVDLLSVEVRKTDLATFNSAWREGVGRIPGATSSFSSGGRRGPSGNALEIRIEGDSLEEMAEVSKTIQEHFSEFEGVNDVSDNLKPGRPQIAIRMRDGSSALGVTVANVSSQLQAALSGVSVEHIYSAGEEFELFVELERDARDSLSDLELFPIRMPSGDAAPLGSIAHIDTISSYAEINRVNGARTVTVQAAVDEDVANAAAISREFMDAMAPELEATYRLRLVEGGQAEQSEETLGSMTHGVILGLFGIFILLSLQFQTFTEPIIVMLAIPFAFIGVIFGNVLIGEPLTSQGLLGFASLAGIVVNDSILLILFIKEQRKLGADAITAATTASRQRFRAVFLTSLTTAAGLLPLLFETSRQAQALIPMATAIVFGITASTLLVLVGLPAVYALLDDLRIVRAPAADEHHA